MPLYEIEHCISLSKVERDQIARAITQIHTRKFSTPSLFVNIRFTDCSLQNIYIAGEQRSVNRILAFVRGGGPRTQTHLGELAEQILGAWNKIVNGGKKGHGDREMKVVTIVGGISTGIESGFLLPPAGDDTLWLKNHQREFERLAAQGDNDFIGLVEEMQNREDLVRELGKSAE